MNDVDGLCCLGTIALALLSGMGAVIWHGVRSRDRWLTPGEKVELGTGEYRTAPATSDPRLLRRRWIVMAIAVISIPWSAITLFALVPAGILFALLGLDNGTGYAWFPVTVGIAALDGIPLAIVTAMAAFSVVQRSRRGRALHAVAAMWSLGHHAALVVAGVALTLGPSYDDGLGSFTAWTAGFGVAHAIALGVAAWLARPEPVPPA